MTEWASNKPNLSAMRTDMLLIKTFGCENEQLKECDVIEFCVKGRVVDSSTVQMTAQESFKHLVDLSLPDCPAMNCRLVSRLETTSSRVSVPEIWNGGFGPVTKKTTLGCVRSGPLPQELRSDLTRRMLTALADLAQQARRRTTTCALVTTGSSTWAEVAVLCVNKHYTTQRKILAKQWSFDSLA